MFIIEFVLSFSLAALFLTHLKIKAVLVYKKIKYLKNDEFNDILKEWKSIRKQLGIKGLSKDISTFYYRHHETIINTKIIKRYNKYFELDEIPLYVFKYTAFKVKTKLDEELSKTKKQSEQKEKVDTDDFKKAFNNFYKNYYNKSGSSNSNSPPRSKFANPNQYYKVLGASQNDDLKTIKKKYRDKMKIYHPDKLSSLSEQEKKKGEEESKKINEAYNYICKTKK